MKNDFSMKKEEINSNTALDQIKHDYSDELTLLVDSFAQQLIPLMNYPNKNVVVSPLSIFQVLSLIANGAKGETLSCILRVLRQADCDLVHLNNLNITFRNAFSYKNDKNIFLTSNALLFRMKPEYDFRSIASHDYDALISELKDISSVNKWISKQTNGKINCSVSNISPETNFLIINTVYFLGEWKYSFSPKNFYKDLFYPNYSSPYTIEYMKGNYDSNDVLFFEHNDSQIIQLPYKNPSLSAIIILPKTLRPDDYIKKVDIKNDLLKKFQTSKIKLSLPKFKIEFNASLKEPLRKMGMEICFTEKADFSDAIIKEKICIGDVIHNTFIEVNETGTEATSVTSIFTKSISKSDTKPEKEIKVNKPFIFLIKNSMVQQEFLFIAKIEKV
jgi:serpin B